MAEVACKSKTNDPGKRDTITLSTGNEVKGRYERNFWIHVLQIFEERQEMYGGREDSKKHSSKTC